MDNDIRDFKKAIPHEFIHSILKNKLYFNSKQHLLIKQN